MRYIDILAVRSPATDWGIFDCLRLYRSAVTTLFLNLNIRVLLLGNHEWLNWYVFANFLPINRIIIFYCFVYWCLWYVILFCIVYFSITFSSPRILFLILSGQIACQITFLYYFLLLNKLILVVKFSRLFLYWV